jgi:hypothetical protein
VGKMAIVRVADAMGVLVATGSAIGCATKAKSQADAVNISIAQTRINSLFKRFLLIP